VCRSRSSPGAITFPDLSCVLLYPNTKQVAFASLGFLKVSELLRRSTGLADVSYMPDGRDDPVISPRQRLLLGSASGREVRRFDIVAFSVSYENDFANVPEMLIMAGLPAPAAERKGAFPLVVCGGFTMSSNPLPVADFVDVAVIGEAECVIGPLLEALAEGKAHGSTRQELLERIAEIDGTYVPSLGERKVGRVWSPTADIAPEPAARTESHFGEMHLVEIGRGCGRGCLFCAAGSLYRPVRMRAKAAVLDACGDFAKIGLVGTAVGDHPAIAIIMRDLLGGGRELGISSLRAECVTTQIADLLVMGGVRTLAIAPETGTEELRRRIGKPITQDQIQAAVRVLAEAGISTIKLYFMIGLPGETDDDAGAIVRFVGELAKVRGKSRLSVAVAPFVPKPQTPFQWAAFAARDVLKRRLSLLKGVSLIRGCSVKTASIEEAWVEAVLARGGRTLGEVLLKAAREKRSLRTLLKRTDGIDPTVGLDVKKPLPWDFIDGGVSKKRLLEQYEVFQRA
jgi:radical SAM superfamily enzyme YgiQ (UPF0313 family)